MWESNCNKKKDFDGVGMIDSYKNDFERWVSEMLLGVKKLVFVYYIIKELLCRSK